jgi:replicative superfamily II helicase
VRRLLNQAPIESKFIQALPDHLNAEVVGGTVVNIDEAVRWLTYTYLYHRFVSVVLSIFSLLSNSQQNLSCF